MTAAGIKLHGIDCKEALAAAAVTDSGDVHITLRINSNILSVIKACCGVGYVGPKMVSGGIKLHGIDCSVSLAAAAVTDSGDVHVLFRINSNTLSVIKACCGVGYVGPKMVSGGIKLHGIDRVASLAAAAVTVSGDVHILFRINSNILSVIQTCCGICDVGPFMD